MDKTSNSLCVTAPSPVLAGPASLVEPTWRSLGAPSIPTDFRSRAFAAFAMLWACAILLLGYSLLCLGLIIRTD